MSDEAAGPDDDMADTRFSLPSVDDAPSTEAGVIVLALDPGRLLAGLGLAALAEDPALVTLAVDQARHDALAGLTADSLVELGARRWRSASAALAEAAPPPAPNGSLRQMWERTVRTVGTVLDGPAPATAVYLAACWLRRGDIEKLVADGSPPG
jgi:Family of unknown function (DUF6187)